MTKRNKELKSYPLGEDLGEGLFVVYDFKPLTLTLSRGERGYNERKTNER